jgi:SAM-dependent methyltransferase
MRPELYERMWGRPEYRATAPGEIYAYTFIEWAKPHGKIIDFGCGTGRGAMLVQALTGGDVLALDFAGNALDPAARAVLDFRKHDLREPLQENVADFGYCTDVLEHIAPEDVETVLRNVFVAARRVFLAISTVPDHFGPATEGEPLHLTVQPIDWWREKLTAMGVRIDREEEQPTLCFFYGSIYASGEDFMSATGINVGEDRLRENIMANLRADVGEICPHEVQDTQIYLLAGGPSLADHEAEIIELGRSGAPIVTVNGTYNWLLERGIKPAAQIMVDGREFNARFVDPVVPTCKYLMSSQTSHEAVAKLPKEQVFLFHSGDTPIVKECFDAYCQERGVHREWYPVYGGTTVVGRGLVALAMLGFRNIEVFGWDSCLRGDKHHAYAQPENDNGHVVEVTIGGRTFSCHPWMVVQAHEFPKIIRFILGPIPDFNLSVRGDGLIAHLLNHAAVLAGKGQ